MRAYSITYWKQETDRIYTKFIRLILSPPSRLPGSPPASVAWARVFPYPER